MNGQYSKGKVVSIRPDWDQTVDAKFPPAGHESVSLLSLQLESLTRRTEAWFNECMLWNPNPSLWPVASQGARSVSIRSGTLSGSRGATRRSIAR
jgi:hypothetical protein